MTVISRLQVESDRVLAALQDSAARGQGLVGRTLSTECSPLMTSKSTGLARTGSAAGGSGPIRAAPGEGDEAGGNWGSLAAAGGGGGGGGSSTSIPPPGPLTGSSGSQLEGDLDLELERAFLQGLRAFSRWVSTHRGGEAALDEPELATLTGLFLQSRGGDCPEGEEGEAACPFPPVVLRAWRANVGMSQAVVMTRFLDSLDAVLPGWKEDVAGEQ